MSENPLFLYLPFQSVHGPLQVPKKYTDMYPNVKNTERKIYSGCWAMDEDFNFIFSGFKLHSHLRNGYCHGWRCRQCYQGSQTSTDVQEDHHNLHVWCKHLKTIKFSYKKTEQLIPILARPMLFSEHRMEDRLWRAATIILFVAIRELCGREELGCQRLYTRHLWAIRAKTRIRGKVTILLFCAFLLWIQW